MFLKVRNSIYFSRLVSFIQRRGTVQFEIGRRGEKLQGRSELVRCDGYVVWLPVGRFTISRNGVGYSSRDIRVILDDIILANPSWLRGGSKHKRIRVLNSYDIVNALNLIQSDSIARARVRKSRKDYEKSVLNRFYNVFRSITEYQLWSKTKHVHLEEKYVDQVDI